MFLTEYLGLMVAWSDGYHNWKPAVLQFNPNGMQIMVTSATILQYTDN